MKQMSTSEADGHMADLVHEVARQDEMVTLTRGDEAAVLISMPAFRLLERVLEKLEDQEDIREAERILNDPDEEWTPLEEVARKLGLEDALHD